MTNWVQDFCCNFQGDEPRTLEIFKRIYWCNTGNRDYSVYKIKPNEEFEQRREDKKVVRMMFDQTVSIFRDHPRSILIISTLQFGIFFVCVGMLLFFPDILNQTATYLRGSASNSTTDICEIVERAIETKKNQIMTGNRTCIETLDITAYSYAFILEFCYTIGFIIVALLVNYIGRLSIFSFMFFSTGICGFLIVMVQNPVISTYFYVWLLVSGVSANLLNTVTYDLFPTNLRSLAMSLSMMMGRLGEFKHVQLYHKDFKISSLSRFTHWGQCCRANA